MTATCVMKDIVEITTLSMNVTNNLSGGGKREREREGEREREREMSEEGVVRCTKPGST